MSNHTFAPALCLVLALATSPLVAGGRKANTTGKTSAIYVFDGMKSGDIDVKLIVRSDHQARVLIKNNTKQPLTVRMPAAFAGVPVLAQNLGGGRSRDRDSSSNNNNQFQGMGMGMGMGGMGMGMGMGGMGGGMGRGMGGGGFFNVAAEKLTQFRVPAVCLEHGKRDPKANIPYELKPIDSLTDKKEVHQLLQMLGSGQIDQRAAQAAAWHLQNGLSWQYLATKQIKHLNGTSEPYFHGNEVQRGAHAAAIAIAAAQQQPAETLPPGSTALSQRP